MSRLSHMRSSTRIIRTGRGLNWRAHQLCNFRPGPGCRNLRGGSVWLSNHEPIQPRP